MKTITLISTFALLGSFAAFADANVSTNGQTNLIKFGKKMVTREYAKEALARAKYKINGGLVRKAGSAKGYFVLLNAQKSVPCDNLKAALDVIDMRVHIQMKTVQLDSLSIASIPNEISKAGGNVGVALVDDPTLPALLSAPEEGWSLVNVARLSDADKAKVRMFECLNVRIGNLKAKAFRQFQHSNIRTFPHEPDDIAMVTERRLHALQPQQLRELRVVAEDRMRVERQMAGVDREIRVHRRLDHVVDAALDPPDAAAPGNAVMDDEELRARLRRGLHRLHARIHGKGHYLHLIPDP